MPVGFVTSTASTANTTTYTFNNVPIGAAAADRIVIVSCSWVGNGGQRALNNASIGGVSATIHVQHRVNAGDDPACAIISAPVPSGTTATISLQLSGGGGSMNIGTYRGVGLASQTPHHTNLDDNSNGAASLALNVPKGGNVVAHCMNRNENTAITLVGVNTDFEDREDDGSAERYAGGHATGLPEEAGRLISATGGNSNAVLVAASWADIPTGFSSIFHGEDQINAIKHGSNDVVAVYHGSNLIFEAP